MLGQRSQNPDLISFNSEPERILGPRTTPTTMAEELSTAKPMKKYFTHSIYTKASCIRIPNMNANHCEIKSIVIQLLPSFYRQTNEDSYKHLEFFEVHTYAYSFSFISKGQS